MKCLDYSKMTLAEIEEVVRQGERARLEAKRQKLIDLLKKALSHACDGASITIGDMAVTKESGRAGKAPSRKLSGDECATLVCAGLTTDRPRTIQQVLVDIGELNRDQVARGLKVLMDEGLAVVENPTAKRGKKYLLFRKPNESAQT